jgi:putative nucleotidyltransferase with HDIG domain
MQLLQNQISISQKEEDIFRLIGACADDLEYPCFAIGGFVRDKFLDRSSKDIDFVCEGSGIRLAKRVSDQLGEKSKLSVFRNFGTAHIAFEDWDLEFVGARKESYRRDSRKPVVENGTLSDDQLRRDFTINALALGVNQNNFGEFVDPFEGLKDLEEKLLRTPQDPDQTFSDDPLRMMRAVRFATQLGFKIHPESFRSIKRQHQRIEIVSAERVLDELNKLILAPKPSRGFKLLDECGLLDKILPEMSLLKGVEVREGKAHKDNFYHTLQVLDNLAEMSDDLWLRWAAIFHDIAKPQTKRFSSRIGWTFHGHEVLGARQVPAIFKRLKMPLDDRMKFVQSMVLLHLRPISLTKENVTDSAIRRLLFDAGDDIDKLMLLCKADITSKNQKKVKRYLENFELVEQKLQEVEEKDRVRNWQPPISGETIMQTFAIKPGRHVGEIKKAIREAILDGDIENSYEDAFSFMLKKGKELGLEQSQGSE